MNPRWIVPEWSVPARVRAVVTTRSGGVSTGPWGLAGGAPGGLNLGARCGDDPEAVLANRARLRAVLPAEPVWLEQVHGTRVIEADRRVPGTEEPVGDASVAGTLHTVCAVLAADCLSVLLAAQDGSAVAAAHAGWRGLAGGVLEAAVGALRARAGPAVPLAAWLGPAIGPASFEVGSEVRERFCDADAAAAAAFDTGPEPGKWLANLYALARMRLAAAGVPQIDGGGLCTVADPVRFYSFRRDRATGRMAACIWLERSD